jgi:RNA polymerase sigma factor (TIGR02999 family)
VPDAPDDATRLLERLRAGDEAAQRELFERVHDELRRLAASYMEGERREHTLQPTALVNEAFVRLARGPLESVESRAQFFRTAALAMRRVLVDHARRRGRAKREGVRVELAESLAGTPEPDLDLVALEDALSALESTEPELARLVEMRFFAGMEPADIARVEQKSERTVRRDLLFARGWLRRRLEGSAGDAERT